MMPRLAPIAVAALVAATVLAVGTAAGPATAETSCDGVVVVVDARAVGGSITSRCASGDPASGLAALEQAGHTYSFVPGIPGFVCTIDQRPNPCNMAPANAYWSYWHAAAGGDWVYSSQGAGFRDPAPGQAEGWRFGDGSKPPGTSPFPAPAPAPAPEPAPTPQPEPAPEPTSSSPPAGTTGSSGSTGSSSGSSGSSSGSSGTSSGSSGTSSGSSGSSSGAGGPSPEAGGPSPDRPDADTDGPTSPTGNTDPDAVDPDAAGPDTADGSGPDTAGSDTAEPEVLASEVGPEREGSDAAVDEDPLASDGVVVATGSRGGRVPTGPLTGGVLLAGIAGATLWQRNRRSA